MTNFYKKTCLFEDTQYDEPGMDMRLVQDYIAQQYEYNQSEHSSNCTFKEYDDAFVGLVI